MKQILTGILLFLFAAGVSAQSEIHRFTLEDCLDYAFGNNYNLQSMRLSERSAESAYQQSKMERLPSLSASASESLSDSKGADASISGSYGVSASMTLYQGGTITNTIEQNKLKLEQSALQTS
ncbi:MAG: TolC family protein, partial [Dysgonamonadaceae bacterium]|nr:TolC family protein [Dysgonamonadaceae bacterium]